MNNRILCAVVALFFSTLCFSQNKDISFEMSNSFQVSKGFGEGNAGLSLVGFTMAPGIGFTDRWVLSLPIRANLYAKTTSPQSVSEDAMAGLSVMYKNGLVDYEASHLFGLYSTSVKQMESSFSLMFNRGEDDRSSFYKIGVSYLLPYDRNVKGMFCVSAGLGLRFSSRK